MLYCHACKIWVQPVQWINLAFHGTVDFSEACPACHQALTQPKAAAHA